MISAPIPPLKEGYLREDSAFSATSSCSPRSGGFLFSGTPPCGPAGEPLSVVVTGLEGEALKNVQAALTLPPGLIQEGVLNRQLLDIFMRRAPEKVVSALEPLGYYHARSRRQPGDAPGKRRGAEGSGCPGGTGAGFRRRYQPERGRRKERNSEGTDRRFPLEGRGRPASGEIRIGTGCAPLKSPRFGYLGAKFTTRAVRVYRGEFKGEIELALETGDQFRYGEVTFEGAPMYPKAYLERFLDFMPGELCSYTKTYQTQLNPINSDLLRLGYDRDAILKRPGIILCP